DASDHVLYEPGSAGPSALLGSLSEDFASELSRIYANSRSERQLAAELARLDTELGVRRGELGAIQARTRGLIESRLDATVRQAFRQIAEELPGHLLALDRDLERLVCDYLDAEQIAYARVPTKSGAVLEVSAHPGLPHPLQDGLRVALGGDGPEGSVPLSLGHPLVQSAAAAARRATSQPFQIRLAGASEHPELSEFRGRRGRLRVEKLLYPGFEPVERLLPVAVFAGEPKAAHAPSLLSVLQGPLEPEPGLSSGVSDGELDEAAEEAIFLDEREVSAAEHRLFARAMAQIERCMDDRVLLGRRERDLLLERIRGTREQAAAATGSDARTRAETALRRAERELEAVEAELERLQSRHDENYRRWRERAHQRRYAPPVREVILEAEFIVG
ncbi:MAG TPA: hypothetical protein VG963_25390, partial [Polyangiaceae bacterium]|nr:hypothetical protein [Polyangiaceae bacterium]